LRLSRGTARSDRSRPVCLEMATSVASAADSAVCSHIWLMLCTVLRGAAEQRTGPPQGARARMVRSASGASARSARCVAATLLLLRF
jgi:hypothetical protein